MADNQSPFLRIPSEIRLIIYNLLFDDLNTNVFDIRNEDPEAYSRRAAHRRSQYSIERRNLAWRTQSTTYILATNTNIYTPIMRTNRQIYKETAHVLYGNRTFSFGSSVEAIVPFFSDLTPTTRQMIKNISLLKKGSLYTRDYDRSEWTCLCEYLRTSMSLTGLDLVVEGGKPANGWDMAPYSVDEFKLFKRIAYEPLEWVWELLTIKGIRKLDITGLIYPCPPRNSAATTFFAAFGASIGPEFTNFMRSEMGIAC